MRMVTSKRSDLLWVARLLLAAVMAGQVGCSSSSGVKADPWEEDAYAADERYSKTAVRRYEEAEAAVAHSPNQIRRIQSTLGELCYDPGPVDGVMGPRTRDAVRAFQRDRGLAADGRVDQDTLEALLSSDE